MLNNEHLDNNTSVKTIKKVKGHHNLLLIVFLQLYSGPDAIPYFISISTMHIRWWWFYRTMADYLPYDHFNSTLYYYKTYFTYISGNILMFKNANIRAFIVLPEPSLFINWSISTSVGLSPDNRTASMTTSFVYGICSVLRSARDRNACVASTNHKKT